MVQFARAVAIYEQLFFAQINHFGTTMHLRLILALGLTAGTLFAAAPQFQKGDRVALIGNTFIEREANAGYIETALTVAHADLGLTFRNFGWSGDTVKGESRGYFKPEEGYGLLINDVAKVEPTVILLNYGANAAWNGEAGLNDFRSGFEKLIVDAEMLQMMIEYLKPITVDRQTLGLETIAEVEPGGHFFGTRHTLERYEDAFYTPLVSDWSNYETWEESGARTATERANTIWKQLLRDYEQPPLDPATDEALEAYVTRRKREINKGA